MYRVIPLAKFTLVLGTTDEYCLLSPLRDRMKLVLRFQFYAEPEIQQIVLHRAKALEWDIEDLVPPFIAKRSRGTPRLALRLLQACRRVCRALGEKRITLDHLRKACSLEGLDDQGLGPIEQQYLPHWPKDRTASMSSPQFLGFPLAQWPKSPSLS